MLKVSGSLAARIAVFAIFLAIIPGTFAQEAEEVVFEPPEDLVLMWAKRAAIIVTTISILTTLFVLAARRNRLAESQSRWLLFLGICVFPVPVTFLSSGIGMEASKEVEFCGSCHRPMGPFVDDMRNPRSDTLAAIHYKNWYIQGEHCWTCHSDYGIAGTTQAKMTGLLHITKVTFDAWEAPIKLYGPYKWTTCLGCHAKSALFKAPRGKEDAHEGVLAEVLGGGIGCTECHEMAHPPRSQRTSK